MAITVVLTAICSDEHLPLKDIGVEANFKLAGAISLATEVELQQ